MRDSYDSEGYHCLIIAILMGVNAREARFLYEHGLNNPISQKILKKKHPKIVRVSTRKERKEVIQQLRSEGYSIEAVSYTHLDVYKRQGNGSPGQKESEI